MSESGRRESLGARSYCSEECLTSATPAWTVETVGARQALFQRKMRRDIYTGETNAMLYDFGSSVGGLIQMAYIVEDLPAAVDQWVSQLKVGPWFILDSFRGGDPVYRGSPSQAEVTIGMAYSGSMLIELIQMKDEHPSVYKEVRDQRGFGFHHFGVATHGFDADVKTYEARGFDLAFLARVPTGGRVGYLDTHGRMPGFVELIEADAAMEAHFTGYYRAALGWDGKDPIRPFL